MADGVASIGFGELGWRVQEFRESKIIIISLLLPIITRTMFEIHFFPRTYFRVDFVYDIRMFICFVVSFRLFVRSFANNIKRYDCGIGNEYTAAWNVLMNQMTTFLVSSSSSSSPTSDEMLGGTRCLESR